MATTTKTKRAKKAVEAPTAAPVVDTVPQEIIQAIYDKRARAAALAAEANKLYKELAAEEAPLLSRFKNGAHAAPGIFVAGVDVQPGSCRPKWKDEAIILAAAAGLTPTQYEDSVKAKYPPKPVESLMITKIG